MAMLIGIVENGAIHLRVGVQLPEHGEVFVTTPEDEVPMALIGSPQLADPEDFQRFEKQVVRRSDRGQV